MRILIVVHLFYHDMWPELAACVASCPASFDLIVTVVDREDEARAMVLSQFPNAVVEKVANRGFDVGPFIHVLNNVDLSSYDIVVKLHSKRDVTETSQLRGNNVGRSEWRRRLLSFCSTTDRWNRTLKIFEDSCVGMVGDGSLAVSPFADPVKNKKNILNVFSQIGLKFRGGYFIAGTMFAVRAKLVRGLQGVYNINDFDTPNRKRKDCLPHFLERIFGYIVYAQGFKLASWDNVPFEHDVFWSNIKHRIFHVHFSRRHKIYKCFGIHIWWSRLEKD